MDLGLSASSIGSELCDLGEIIFISEPQSKGHVLGLEDINEFNPVLREFPVQ